MKRVILFIQACLLGIVFTACRLTVEYPLLHETSQISGITIVSVGFDNEGKFSQSEICTVSDIDEFILRFRDVTCYSLFGDPTGLAPDEEDATVIKIAYDNGEYELINYYGESWFTHERGFQYYKGYYSFDKDQFAELIQTYID